MQACGYTPIWSGERVLRTHARGLHMNLPAFKRWIVEQAVQPGTSMAGLAMRNPVNANPLRRWLQMHGVRQLTPATPRQLPVTIASELPA